jgi:bifunctional non-homologous end joining protein LigD
MALIDSYRPMLLDERPLDLEEPGWFYEQKLDGYRVPAEFDATVQLRTRNGADATPWFPEVAQSFLRLKNERCIVDGEVCVFDESGRSVIDQLQDRGIRGRCPGCPSVVYCVFDLLVHRDVDITQQPLRRRKAALSRIFKERPHPYIVYVDHFDKGAAQLFTGIVIPLKLEGLVAKRADSVYQPGVRSRDWVKVKRSAIPTHKPSRT